MKQRSTDKPVRKTYDSPKLAVYGKVSELTEGGRGKRPKPHGGGRRGGKRGRGHGGSRS
jgi:hypothetical protein